MTDTDPGAIQGDIERTRRELGNDVDALTEKVTPSKIMQRQTNRARNAMTSAKERIFGAVGDMQDTVGGTVSDAPHRVAEKAKGNPLAAGLIAIAAAASKPSLGMS